MGVAGGIRHRDPLQFELEVEGSKTGHAVESALTVVSDQTYNIKADLTHNLSSDRSCPASKTSRTGPPSP